MAAIPTTLKSLGAYIKLAKEYDKKDPAVAYFCRMYAVQKGIKLDSKSPDGKKFLFSLMDQLEKTKSSMAGDGNDAVSNDIVAQATVETTAVNLFLWADTEDRKGVFNRNVLKAFYSSNLLFDVLTQWGDLNEQCATQQKYAKWKSTYLHKCMQSGETPIPGPQGSEFEDNLSSDSLYNSKPVDSLYPPTNAVPSLPTNQHSGGFSVHPVTGFPPAGQGSNPGFTGPSSLFNPGGPGYPPPGGSNMPSGAGSSMQPKPRPRADQGAAKTELPPSGGAMTSYSESEPSSSGHEHVDFNLATKYCKYALSALNYEDLETAVENLSKALSLLKPSKK